MMSRLVQLSQAAKADLGQAFQWEPYTPKMIIIHFITWLHVCVMMEHGVHVEQSQKV